MHEIDRYRVIDAGACRREGREASEETVHGIGRGVEVVKVHSRARGCGDHPGNIGRGDVRWQRCKVASQSLEARIKLRRRVQTHLPGKLAAARSSVADVVTASAVKQLLLRASRRVTVHAWVVSNADAGSEGIGVRFGCPEEQA